MLNTPVQMELKIDTPFINYSNLKEIFCFLHDDVRNKGKMKWRRKVDGEVALTIGSFATSEMDERPYK